MAQHALLPFRRPRLQTLFGAAFSPPLFPGEACYFFFLPRQSARRALFFSYHLHKSVRPFPPRAASRDGMSLLFFFLPATETAIPPPVALRIE